MSIYTQNFLSSDSYCGDHVMNANAVSNLSAMPTANQAPVAQTPVEKVIVRRGPQLMVVFSGCPKASTVNELCQANVKVGLALGPGGLATAPRLDDYSYVFVNVGRPAGSTLDRALADLAANGWSIDDSRNSTADLVEPRAPAAPVRAAELTMIRA